MPRGQSMTLSFPPFTKAVKWLVILNSVVFFAELILRIGNRALAGSIHHYGSLIPSLVIGGHGLYLYQIFSYAFFHESFLHILFNMLVLWMFGSQIEMDFGTRQFLEFYTWCLIGAALITIGVPTATSLQRTLMQQLQEPQARSSAFMSRSECFTATRKL